MAAMLQRPASGVQRRLSSDRPAIRAPIRDGVAASTCIGSCVPRFEMIGAMYCSAVSGIRSLPPRSLAGLTPAIHAIVFMALVNSAHGRRFPHVRTHARIGNDGRCPVREGHRELRCNHQLGREIGGTSPFIR